MDIKRWQMNKVLTSSKKYDYQTPKELYDYLDHKFNFDHDPCPANYKEDGLKTEWGHSNFVNPPYGKYIAAWVKKGYEESKKVKIVVFLIPSRTDTKYWHEYVMKSDAIWFIKGRIKFHGCNNGAPFPCAVVIFTGRSLGVSPHIKTLDQEIVGIKNMMRKNYQNDTENAI
jgi:site-specific DNA-methyltransferase (adenine-specific)